MDFKKKAKNAHFSIGTLKKTKTSEFKDESKKNKFKPQKKRNRSYIIPKRFVPKLKPQKALIYPSYLILNTEKIIKENKDNLEIRSVKELLNDENDEDISLSSSSETFSNFSEEEKISNKIYIKDLISNDIKTQLDFKKNLNQK